MTRRELREHCFKLLFCADFYPEGETKEQMEEYFTEPDRRRSSGNERQNWSALFGTYDQKEGMHAFIEKRRPEFEAGKSEGS